jgi:hypothetical protein
MPKQNNNTASELLFLLRQKRYFFHQLKILSEKQHQIELSSSPEMMLDIVSGRRKLLEKISELETKLQPVKNNWVKLTDGIDQKQKLELEQTSKQIDQITEQICSFGPYENLLMQKNERVILGEKK